MLSTTGMGKSTFLLSLIRQDLTAGRGLAVLDPHGSLVNAVLAMLPEERDEDTVLLKVWGDVIGSRSHDLLDKVT